MELLQKMINSIISHLGNTIMGDFTDLINPLSLVMNFWVEALLQLLLIISFPLLVMGIYKLAKGRGLKIPILCFIPGIHLIYLGLIAKEINILSKRIRYAFIWLPMLYIISMVPLDLIPIIGQIVNIVEVVVDKLYYILLMTTIHRVYEIYTPKKADSMIIIAIPLQFLNSLFMFKIRNNKPVNSTIILDYDFDGEYDENVTIHIEDQNSSKRSITQNKYCEEAAIALEFDKYSNQSVVTNMKDNEKKEKFVISDKIRVVRITRTINKFIHQFIDKIKSRKKLK